MKKIIFCFIYDGMTDFEVTLACHLLDCEIITIAFDKRLQKGTSGMKVMPDMTVKEALGINENVIGIIIPGGINIELRSEFIELLIKLNKNKKMIAAICAGTQYIARAGLLEDKKYTTTLDEETMKECFPDFLKNDPFPRENFMKENIIKDDNIITAVGNAFIDFAAEINEFITGDTVNKEYIKRHYRGEKYFI